jgi:phosphoribosylaminoimidazolecarboxamide formyltransferase/IMP cyclohydrolase
MTQIQGKELSYNNIRDLDVAWKMVSAYNQFAGEDTYADGKGVFTAALKHNSPCGAAVGVSALDSYQRAFACDPVSIFGGIIGINAVVDEEAATEISKTFLEVIAAPGFTDGARKVFAAKKNLRLITAALPANDSLECLSVAGGLLAQSRDDRLFEKWEVVTKARPTVEQEKEMAFGLVIAQFAKSNAIVVVKDRAAIGIGAGQTNRIWAAEQALARARANTEAAGAAPAEVLVSDAFFPFRDCVDKAAEYGITAIVQPGGSLRDQDSIDACDAHGIAMVFTGTRHFKH